jgi:hypothetical protein
MGGGGGVKNLLKEGKMRQMFIIKINADDVNRKSFFFISVAVPGSGAFLTLDPGSMLF